ncbi:non-ribosomal peptide synthetase [Tahibacter soli]|uniref:Amino acid adenylation domain-containing protein n=1 Tax=Tahibacter soli TaxID=2983605 RepID=A0A9X3YSF7_9GAMM|nr:non-ribosomal peptide synthetase [Tahibacter soli]MDC8016148.1 amino acid adenylation domain-containing protein [Tahibacter soli]
MNARRTLEGLSEDARRELIAGLLKARERKSGSWPLSPAQIGMWLQQNLAPDNTAYNMPLAFCLHGRLPDARALIARMLADVVARHPALRTVFEAGDAEPAQRVLDAVDVDLPMHDIGEAGANWQAVALARCGEQASRAFDLAAGPLFRFSLLRVSDELHVLVATFHHIVMDGWSIGVFLKDFAKSFVVHGRGRTVDFDPLPVTYRDYVERMRTPAARAAAAGHVDYWKRRLEGAPAALNLPVQFRRTANAAFRGALHGFRIPLEVSRRLTALGNLHGATGFMTMLATFYALLARICDASDIVLGVSTSNRDDKDYRNMLGLFSDVLPMRARCDRGGSFVDLLRHVRENCLADYEHSATSLTTIIEHVRPARGSDRGLPFQAGFDFQNTPWPALVLDLVTLLPGDAGSAKLDLNFNLSKEQDRLVGSFEYDTDLFSEGAIRNIEARYQMLLKRIVERPAQALDTLDLLDADEKHRIVHEWNVPAVAVEGAGASASVLDLIDARSRSHPGHCALDDAGERVDYATLARRTDALARRLAARGIGRGDRVGLYFSRGAAYVVALIGVMKAGATYVPLDPALNDARLDDMVDAASVATVLTTRSLASRWPVARPVSLVAIEDALAEATDGAMPPAPRAGDVAYIVYTSGTSGRPKGVLISHGALLAFVRGASTVFNLRSNDRVLQFASIGFDTSAEEIFPALASGACLAFADANAAGSAQRFLEEAERRDISVLNLPTALWHEVVDALQPPVAARLPTAARLVVIGGEAALPSALARWHEAAGDAVRLVNTYGPTETTVSVTAAELERLPDPQRRLSLPIGRPYPGVRAYVLDAHGQPVAPGLYGELFIGGPSVALGYDGAPELTAQRFVADPFDGRPDARMYRTGDFVRWLDDGSLEFAGRRDGQVKLAGHRIELAEIEGALLRHADVAQAAVVVQGDETTRRLAAFVVARPVASLDAAAVREWLRTRLPAPMQPSVVALLPHLPVTVNGKIDRAALAARDDGAASSSAAPLDPEQALLAAVWAQVLGVPNVGAHDNFFDLGGHSLLLIRLLSRVRRVFGVDVTLAQAFDAPTVARLARTIASIRDADGGVHAEPIAAQPRPAGADARFPLSFEQERLWFLYRLDPASSAYNSPSALRIAGAFDLDALQASIDALVARHEILRTAFVDDDGEPQQIVCAQRPVRVVAHDLRELDHARREERLHVLIAHDAAQPFDLRHGPVLRVGAVRCADDDTVLLFNWHHIVTDAWSLTVLVRELSAGYAAFAAGREPAPAPLPIQFGDYAHWQRRQAAGAAYENSVAYWRERLRDAPEPIEFAPRRHGARTGTARAGRVERRYDAALRDGLVRVARGRDATLFIVCLAAFQWLLARCGGRTDIAVGTPISGRSHEALEPLIGFFVNTVVVRCELAGAVRFADALEIVRTAALGAYAHRHVPFDRVVRDLRDGGAGPSAFDVSFVLENADELPAAFPGARVDALPRGAQDAKFRLSLSLREDAGGIACEWEYPADEYDADAIERLADRYAVLLRGVAHDADAVPSMTSAEEQKTIVDEWSDGGAAPIEPICLHARVERQARLTPDAPALVCESTVLTYAQLDARAERLARHLHRGGVGPDVLVGVCAARSADLAVALLAVWKAGGAYVALDPVQPPARLAQLLDDAGAPWLIGDRVSIESFAGDARTFALEDLDALPDGEAFAETVTPSNLAYVIFTSGSTGRPKGVLIEHRHAVNLAQDLRARLADLGVPPDGRWAWNASFAFDASLQALLAWGDGACLHLLSADTRRDPALLLDYLKTHRIDVLDATPLQIESLLQRAGDDTDLPVLVIGGEAIGVDLWQRIAALPRGALNVYGPTETTVDATCARIEGTRPTIGRPLANVRCYVLDAHGAVQPEGVPGELCIAGAGVARGYLNRPELTAERFVEIDVAGRTERVYRTGDIARWIDGQLDYLGRRDGQVKIRGYRIEVEEVAQQLRRLHGVAAAVVTMRNDSLVGYVVALTVASDEWLDALGAQLRTVLPEYMVPSHLVALDALPTTANGKLDHAALPAPDTSDTRRPYVAPASDTEKALAAIWAELFHIDASSVSAAANFFALGGHSLLLMRMISAIRHALDVDVPLKALFDAADLRACADVVDAMRRESALADESLEEMQW